MADTRRSSAGRPTEKSFILPLSIPVCPIASWSRLILRPVKKSVLPLSQADDGVFDPTGKTLYFTRLRFQNSRTKRYKGGFIQNLWKYTAGEVEAVPMTADF